MVFSKNNDDGGYEYDLPGEPFRDSKAPIGKRFFEQPSCVSSDVKPFDSKEESTWKICKFWFLGCAVMLILGGIFEFGILGKDGKQGPLCHSVFSQGICQILAGSAPSMQSKK